MGDANRKIKELKLAEIGFFLYGTVGDVNVIWTHKTPEREKNLEWISESYVNDLEADWENGEEIQLASVKATLKAVTFPTEKVDPEKYREIAEMIISKVPDRYARPNNQEEKLLFFTHDRMLEMVILAERGRYYGAFAFQIPYRRLCCKWRRRILSNTRDVRPISVNLLL